jgi:hypothetical protein
MDTLLFLILFQGAALIGDGASTLYSPGHDVMGNKLQWQECNPVSQQIIGKYPSWRSMAVPGIVEIASASAISTILHSAHVRRWYIPQLSISCAHGIAAGVNMAIKLPDRNRVWR